MRPRLIFQTGLFSETRITKAKRSGIRKSNYPRGAAEWGFWRPRKKFPASAGLAYAEYIRRMPDALQLLVTANYAKVGLIPRDLRALFLELFTNS
jgi:hypothetical protein